MSASRQSMVKVMDPWAGSCREVLMRNMTRSCYRCHHDQRVQKIITVLMYVCIYIWIDKSTNNMIKQMM